jgi:hypothetical protein
VRFMCAFVQVPVICCYRFAALELQSLKYELEVRSLLPSAGLVLRSLSAMQVERARSAAMELRNKQLQAQLDLAGDNPSVGLPSFAASEKSRRPSIAPSALAPVHVQVRAAARVSCARRNVLLSGARHGFGRRWRRRKRQQRKGAGDQWTQARQHCVAGERIAVEHLLIIMLTARLQMPHMNTSIPEFVDPRVRHVLNFIVCLRAVGATVRAIHAVAYLQVPNEPVQCAQKTEKGLSGYAFNKQTGLVNKVCSAHRCCSVMCAMVLSVAQYWKRRWCELVGSQMTMFTLLPSVCALNSL